MSQSDTLAAERQELEECKKRMDRIVTRLRKQYMERLKTLQEKERRQIKSKKYFEDLDAAALAKAQGGHASQD